MQLQHGTVIIATGHEPAEVDRYLYGKDRRVITRLEMEDRLNKKELEDIDKVVFIQCVGSREKGREYCSRTCCNQTVRQALEIKNLRPHTSVFVLYRDMRTYGFAEGDYLKAREQGVIFINYAPEQPPRVQSSDSHLTVDIYDPVGQVQLTLAAELLVLANGVEAAKDLHKLAGLFKLPLNEDRFFVETHAKLSPLDVPRPGIFICGGAHSPQHVAETIAQAQGAAARAAAVLSKPHLLAGGSVARVIAEKCAACLTCVRVCPFSIPIIGADNTAEINGVQCQGCGTCAGACPNGAIVLEHYHTNQLTEKVKAMFGLGGGRA